MKIFPFVYVALLLARRKYLEVACACVASIFSTFISLWLVGPNIFQTWRKIEAGIAFTRETYILQFIPEANGFDHSIFAFIKRFWHRLPGPGPLGHFVSIYLCVAAICGIALYLLKIRHLPLINQVLCLCIASILLPPMSADYTLMHLYVPWGMMVLFAQERWALGERVPGLFAAFVCLAIIFSPESEFIRHGVHLGGQIKCLVLLVLMYIGLTYPFGVSGAPLSAASKVR
jgi:hypothetical protein